MTEDDTFEALRYRTYNSERREYQWINDDGELHRENGPAIVNVPRYQGDREYQQWWLNNKIHRVGGPAVIYVTEEGLRYEGWYHKGHKHRIDGPAVTDLNGTFEYWFNGTQLANAEILKAYVNLYTEAC